MEIKREAMNDIDTHPPTGYPSKKKKYKIEKGRLSVFIIGGFLLLFLGLLTFEFRYLAFDDNTFLGGSQKSNQDTYQSNKDNTKKFSILGFFKKEDSEDKKTTSELNKPTDKADSFIKKLFGDRFISFFSKKNDEQELEIAPESPELLEIAPESPELLETAPESPELVEKSQSEFFDDTVVGETVNKGQYKYSLQIMAIEEEYKSKALNITKKLVKEGYQAYTYKTPVKIVSDTYPNGKYFYRIRVGFFQTKNEAKRIGDKIFQTNASFPQNYYATEAESGEYDGEIITYGFQKNP